MDAKRVVAANLRLTMAYLDEAQRALAKNCGEREVEYLCRCLVAAQALMTGGRVSQKDVFDEDVLEELVSR